MLPAGKEEKGTKPTVPSPAGGRSAASVRDRPVLPAVKDPEELLRKLQKQKAGEVPMSGAAEYSIASPAQVDPEDEQSPEGDWTLKPKAQSKYQQGEGPQEYGKSTSWGKPTGWEKPEEKERDFNFGDSSSEGEEEKTAKPSEEDLRKAEIEKQQIIERKKREAEAKMLQAKADEIRRRRAMESPRLEQERVQQEQKRLEEEAAQLRHERELARERTAERAREESLRAQRELDAEWEEEQARKAGNLDRARETILELEEETRRLKQEITELQEGSGDGPEEFARTLAGALKKDDATYRVGNVVQKVPVVKEVKEEGRRPGIVVAERLQALSQFERDLMWYIKSCLFTGDVDLLCTETIEAAKTAHTSWVFKTLVEQADYGIHSLPESPVMWTKKTSEFLRIAAGLLYERAPESVRTIVSDLQLVSELSNAPEPTVWARWVVTLVATHREFNVKLPKHVSLLEELARKPFVSTPQTMRLWWTTVGAASQLGHIAWRQVAEGLVMLTDKWEAWDLLSPRELRQLGMSIDNNGLSRFGVDREKAQQHFLQMLALLSSTEHKPKKKFAHVAFEDVMQSLDEVGNEPAAHAAANVHPGKGDGKKGDGKGGGCFNCGAADHWSRECPNPKVNPGKGDGKKGDGKGDGKKGVTSKPVCRQWSNKGSCSYGSKCQFRHEQKGKFQSFKKALLAAINEFGSDDEDAPGGAEIEQGNGQAPSPKE